MEPVVERDHMVARFAVVIDAPLACQLDGTFVCFAARIAKHHFLHAGALAELLSKQRLRSSVVPVGGMLAIAATLPPSARPDRKSQGCLP